MITARARKRHEQSSDEIDPEEEVDDKHHLQTFVFSAMLRNGMSIGVFEVPSQETRRIIK